MISTWLFIIIIGDAAQSIEVANMQDCLDLRKYVVAQLEQNPELKSKTVTGCFRNMGERGNQS